MNPRCKHCRHYEPKGRPGWPRQHGTCRRYVDPRPTHAMQLACKKMEEEKHDTRH